MQICPGAKNFSDQRKNVGVTTKKQEANWNNHKDSMDSQWTKIKGQL
jgi:hypothetical protein